MKLFDHLRQQKPLSFALLLFTLSIGVVIGTLITTGVHAAKAQSAAPDAAPLTIPSPTQLGNEFTKLAKKLEPSVVYITASTNPKPDTSAKSRRPRQQDQDDEESPDDNGNANPNDLFRRFFHGGPFGDMNPKAFRREQSGTGFVVDQHGYIITNNHVIDKMDQLKVRLHGDQTEYRARVIGTDTETDLAVIKIDPKTSLAPVVIGNSESVQVGDWAVAIGSPFGLEASVTAGIISATGRDIGAQQFQRFIQTDAAINPGNSGGPLLNIRGEVIGVNTMIATQSGGYQGIGFALPMNMAVRVYNDIIKSGRVTRGSIGVSWARNVKPELMKALGATGGVFVDTVTKGGPADKAGIKPEDIIIGLNGKTVKDGDDLISHVADLPVGSNAAITVDRGGKKMDFNVTIGDRIKVFKDDPRFAGISPQDDDEENKQGDGERAKFGIMIQNLLPKERETIAGLEGRGVRVTRVEPGSFAEDIGLQERDIIIMVNRQPITTTEDVKKVQQNLKSGDAVAFRVMRANPGQPQQPRGAQQYTAFFVSGTLP